MSGQSHTLLELLAQKCHIDCDTLDPSVPSKFPGLVDCTSNQAIAYGELSKPQNKTLVKDAVSRAKELANAYKDVTENELAVDIATIKLSLLIAPNIKGFVHTQTNPYHANDAKATVSDALRIISLYKSEGQASNFDVSRVCIKIPTTFEGLEACRILNHAPHSIATLATAVFCIEQAALAADAGCRYIAPYVNPLIKEGDAIHASTLHADLTLPLTSQHLYSSRPDWGTKVLAASFASSQEILALTGVDHLTISPTLLSELQETKNGDEERGNDGVEASPDGKTDEKSANMTVQQSDIELWKTDKAAFERVTAKGQEKISLAIDFFCDKQDQLLTLVDGIEAWFGKLAA